jgi:hypothetical protein
VNNLQERVARAIHEPRCRLPRNCFGPLPEDYESAAAAVRVVLAEATQAVEALPEPANEDSRRVWHDALGEALAVLAALAEEESDA